MTAKEIQLRTHQFNSLANARHFAANCIKGHMVLMGDNNKYWVASFGFAQKLEAAGYELI